MSAFHGIVIAMYFDEHGVPHFHARHGYDHASVAIATLEVLAGSLPERALRLVREWACFTSPKANWVRVRNETPLEPIAPLP